MKKKILLGLLGLSAVFSLASCRKESYTVSFESNSGSSIDALEVTEDGLVVRPQDPTKEGYTFAGWYTDANFATPWDFETFTVTSDITLYAKWTVNSYDVTFNTNGGSSAPVQKVNHGETVTLPTTTKEGYTFAGWFIDSELTTQYTNQKITGATTLYAKWVEVVATVYTVTFNSTGGTEVATQQVTEDEWGSFTVQKPTDPTRPYKTFAGWYVDEACTTAFDFSGEVTSDLTLYAKWTSEYEMVTTVANFDAGAEAYPGKAKPTEYVTFGRFTFAPGVYFEAATSSKTACVNNQQKDILLRKLSA